MDATRITSPNGSQYALAVTDSGRLHAVLLSGERVMAGSACAEGYPEATAAELASIPGNAVLHHMAYMPDGRPWGIYVLLTGRVVRSTRLPDPLRHAAGKQANAPALPADQLDEGHVH